MRIFLAIPLILVAGCGQNGGSANQSAALNATNASPVETPSPTDGTRGGEAATSESAKDAREVAQRYFEFVAAHKYREAYELWGDRGAAAGGSQQAFAATFDRYEKYQPKVGEPTEIKRTGDQQYIAVAVDVTATLKREHMVGNLSGRVLLRRSADPKEPDSDKRNWRIWGTDIRARH